MDKQGVYRSETGSLAVDSVVAADRLACHLLFLGVEQVPGLGLQPTVVAALPNREDSAEALVQQEVVSVCSTDKTDETDLTMTADGPDAQRQCLLHLQRYRHSSKATVDWLADVVPAGKVADMRRVWMRSFWEIVPVRLGQVEESDAPGASPVRLGIRKGEAE